MSKRFLAALLGAAAVALLAAGCGGGGDSSGDESGSTGSSSSLSKAEFIKQGDEICERGNESIETEANDFAKEKGIDTKSPTKADQEEVIEEVVAPAIKREAEEISDLGVPASDQEAAENVIEAVGRGADEVEEDPAAVLEGKNPLEEAGKLAAAFGFRVCGGGE